jgi:hypothetical protein
LFYDLGAELGAKNRAFSGGKVPAVLPIFFLTTLSEFKTLKGLLKKKDFPSHQG